MIKEQLNIVVAGIIADYREKKLRTYLATNYLPDYEKGDKMLAKEIIDELSSRRYFKK